MLFIFILLIIGTILLYKKRSNYIVHIILCFLMYAFYVYLWFLPSIINNTHYDENKPHTDSAMGVAIMFLFSMPLYLLVHIIFIRYSNKNKTKKIFIIHLIGITLLILQLIIFLIKTNFLS